jgi:hypothetical protein
MSATAPTVRTGLTVTAPNGRADLIVMDVKDSLPSSFALRATTARDRVVIRVGGGCTNMSKEDRERMLAYFVEAFQGYGGVIFSGATRNVDESNAVDPMVTEVPGAVAEANPGCVALGTAPRTGRLGLVGESQLVLDNHGTLANPAMSMLLLVQDGAEREAGWDGDLDAYFALMQQWQNDANFEALGGVFWNGGGVTGKEIMRCAKLGWPTILIKGSGRITDEIAGKLENRDSELLSSLPAKHKITVVDRSSPQELRAALLHYGFLTD